MEYGGILIHVLLIVYFPIIILNSLSYRITVILKYKFWVEVILGRSWMRVGWVRVVGFKDDCWREGYTWVRNRLLGSPFIRWGKSLRRQSSWVNDQRRTLRWITPLVSINRILTYLWNSLCHWSVKIEFWPTFEFHWNSSWGVLWLVDLIGLLAQINVLECSNYQW